MFSNTRSSQDLSQVNSLVLGAFIGLLIFVIFVMPGNNNNKLANQVVMVFIAFWILRTLYSGSSSFHQRNEEGPTFQIEGGNSFTRSEMMDYTQ